MTTTHLLAASGSGGLTWYLTRGSGAVTLVLLTASMCLGIAGKLPWRSRRMPRFAVASLHRNLTLLAVAFLALHVLTTVADSYTPIGLKDAFVPFLSSYRPLWLGLGAVACDLLLALVVTSLLRVRLGFRAWRLTHWLAYASWPVAFAHALGTGSDPRAGWMQALAAVSAAAVLAAIALRLVFGGGDGVRRIALGAAAAGVALAAGLWYRGGPGAAGWAARAGTPATLLHGTTTATTGRVVRTTPRTLPGSFTASLSGTATERQTSDGLVDVHLEGTLAGGVTGRVRIVLEGIPLDGGGVRMTASGVAFAARGTSVYEGSITGLEGTQVTARVSDGSGHTVDLLLSLDLGGGSSALSGTVQGTRV